MEQVNAKRGHAAGHSRAHFTFAFSALAYFRMGMSGSALTDLRQLPVQCVDLLGADVADD